MSRLPDFLIIGAMKAGTTSLYRDLALHPEVFLPEEKEPESLANDRVLSPAGRRAYERLFAGAAPGQICGEASTVYTKLPTHRDVPRRAARVLAADAKLIYLVRHPVDRTISHHRYLYQFDLMPADFDACLRRDSSLLDYSRYGMQLRPWIDAFALARVLVLPFEAYVADRAGAVSAVARFLGIDPTAVRIDQRRVANRTAGLRPLRGVWRRIALSRAYQCGVRPLLPIRGRSKLPWLRRLFAGEPKSPLPAVSEAIRRRVWESLAADMEEFHRLVGLDSWLWELNGPTAANRVGSPAFQALTRREGERVGCDGGNRG